MKESKKFSLNAVDLKSLWIGLLITLSGAALTYAADNLTNIDFGTYTPFVVPVAALAINTARKYLAGR